MPDLNELRKYIFAGHESRNREYKRSMAWDGSFRGTLVKTILGMANIPGGGVIVIGVRQDGERFFLDGVAPEH